MRTRRSVPRAVGSVIAGIGAALMVFAVLADVIGIGGGEGFGYQQMIVFIFGMVLVLAGSAFMLPATGRSADTDHGRGGS